MAAFLSHDWFAQVQGDGAALDDVTIQLMVTGAPGGDVKWNLTVQGGTVAAAAGPASDADVVLTLSYEDAVAVLRGELSLTVLFMQGRMKTAGDPGRLLDLLRATASPDFASARAALEASTEI